MNIQVWKKLYLLLVTKRNNMQKVFLILFASSVAIFASTAPVFIENVHGKPNLHFYKIKKEIAEKMGIKYQVNFKGCIVRQGEKGSVKNNDVDKYYSEKIGKDWKEKLTAKTFSVLSKENNK